MSALVDLRPNISPARELAALIRDTEALRLRVDLLTYHLELSGAVDYLDQALSCMNEVAEDEPPPDDALRQAQDGRKHEEAA